MNTLIDKCILLLFCVLSLLFTPYNSDFIIALLTAVSLSTLYYTFTDLRFATAEITFYSLLLFTMPSFCLFLPLMIYDYPPIDFWETHDPRSLLLRVPAVMLTACQLLCQAFANFRPKLFFFLSVGCATALLMRRRTDLYRIICRKLRKTRDDDTEMKLLLEEKNQSLLEKQDSEIYAATLRERNRIAREIHDNVGHLLTRSILMVGALRIVNKNESFQESLEQLDCTLNQAMNTIRQSVHDLYDSSVNLRDSLQTLIREFTYCTVELTYEMSPEIPRDVKYSFIAIAREALVNIAKHSNADKATISAIEHPGFYQLIIQDNGTTTAPSFGNRYMDSAVSSGIGLTNMQNRIKALNGNLRIQTESGFRIYITVPKS